MGEWTVKNVGEMKLGKSENPEKYPKTLDVACRN